MFDAAIGPRREASSLRMRSVFSAAGTFDAALTPAGLRAGLGADAAAASVGASTAVSTAVSGVLSAVPAAVAGAVAAGGWLKVELVAGMVPLRKNGHCPV